MMVRAKRIYLLNIKVSSIEIYFSRKLHSKFSPKGGIRLPEGLVDDFRASKVLFMTNVSM